MAQDNLSSSPPAKDMATNSPSGKDTQLSILQARQSALETSVAQLLSQRTSLMNSLSPPSRPQEDSDDAEEARAKAAVEDAIARIKTQIRRLQEYNDIKDIGTQLMGLIAEKRGCRIVDVQEEYGIGAED